MSEYENDTPEENSAQPAKGLTRRRFVETSVLASGAAMGLSSCLQPGAQQEELAEDPAFFKDTTPFTQHGQTNLEANLENLGGFITPNHLFFVRNNSRSYEIDTASYTLEIRGDAIETPMTFSYQELMNMPSRVVYAYLECGGNQRSFFGTAMGSPARGTQWGRGGVGMAIWTGVSLRVLLERAGIRDNAVDVQLVGLDIDSPEGGFRRPIPVSKAMDEDTLIAYQMNGEPLPRDHGYPVRALVPGWVGSTSVKWLGHIEVSSEKVWSRNNTSSYVLIGDAYPPQGEASGVVATTQSIKSVLVLPWPAQLPAGAQYVRGYAYSPFAPIQRVEWSADGGATWEEARCIDPPIKYAWRRFEFLWEAHAGSHTLVTRAFDEEGNTQPETIPFNEKGYLYNVPLEHPVQVS